MLLPKSIKKMIAVFRGGLSPQLIILSIALGFSFGLIPGWSGIHTFIVILFMLLNIHTGLFLLTAGFAKSLCLAGAPVLYHLGGAVQDNMQWLLIFLGKIPIIGLTDFSRYAVVGALVTGPIIGIVAGVVFSKLVVKFRNAWVKLEEGSDAYKKWTSKKWVQIIDRILIGKRTKDVRAVIDGKSPTLRKAGLVLVGIPILIFVVAVFLVQDEMLGRYASKTLAKSNGAEVNIASIGLSAFSGSISASQVQVTDPEKPEANRMAVEKLSADAGVYSLLCGKAVIDDIQMEGLTFDTPRLKPGEVFASEKETDELDESDSSDADATKPEGTEKVDKYFKNADKLKENLKKIRKFLPSGKKKTAKPKKTVPDSYLGYLKAKASVTPVPRIIVRNISLEKVKLQSKQFALSNIKITNLSDAPVAFGETVTIEVKSVGTDRSLDMKIDFNSDGTSVIDGTFANLDLAIMQSQMNDDNSMQMDKGLASGKFGGTISRDLVDIAIDLDLKDMSAKSGGKGMFGLDAKTTSEVLAVMETLQTQLRIFGPMTSPKIAFDTDDLDEQFNKMLAAAGGKRLESELQKQIDKNLGGKGSEEIKKVIGEPEDIIKGLGDLFGGKKKK